MMCLLVTLNLEISLSKRRLRFEPLRLVAEFCAKVSIEFFGTENDRTWRWTGLRLQIRFSLFRGVPLVRRRGMRICEVI